MLLPLVIGFFSYYWYYWVALFIILSIWLFSSWVALLLLGALFSWVELSFSGWFILLWLRGRRRPEEENNPCFLLVLLYGCVLLSLLSYCWVAFFFLEWFLLFWLRRRRKRPEEENYPCFLFSPSVALLYWPGCEEDSGWVFLLGLRGNDPRRKLPDNNKATQK